MDHLKDPKTLSELAANCNYDPEKIKQATDLVDNLHKSIHYVDKWRRRRRPLTREQAIVILAKGEEDDYPAKKTWGDYLLFCIPLVFIAPLFLIKDDSALWIGVILVAVVFYYHWKTHLDIDDIGFH